MSQKAKPFYKIQTINLAKNKNKGPLEHKEQYKKARQRSTYKFTEDWMQVKVKHILRIKKDLKP